MCLQGTMGVVNEAGRPLPTAVMWPGVCAAAARIMRDTLPSGNA
jgi:hypothetical protein